MLTNEERIAQAQLASDCAYWAYNTKVNLDGRPFAFTNHEYQVDPMQSDAVEECSRKGAQIGWTSIKMLKSIHGLIYGRYPQGVLYLFPTRDDVTDFSKGRFQPLINDNPMISRHVRDTDAANIKRVGKGMLYFRGAKSTRTIGGFKKTSSQLKCHDDQTEVLTRNQWKKFADVTMDDEVATRSPSGDFMWQKVTHIHRYQHTGKMLHFKSRGVDLCVTPNHRLLLCAVQGGAKIGEWFDLAENVTGDQSHIRFINEISTFVVPTPEAVDYDGEVACVSVPNGTLLTRRNGYTVWSGNSVPVDRLVFDEVDEMEPAMIDLALERISHSDVREIDYIGTPTIPDYGIDLRWQKSDQRLWFLRCGACNVETCLEQEFEENGWDRQKVVVEMADGRVVKICRNCGRPFTPNDRRRWVVSYPSRSKDLVGWWVSQLNSVYVRPEAILSAFQDPKRSIAETYNSKIGMPYIEASNRLSVEEVLACCGSDGIATSDDGPCTMGVDQGKGLHVVIGKRAWGHAGTILHIGEYRDWSELDQLMKRFHVGCCVVDALPEMRNAQAFAMRHSGRVWLHYYDENRRGPAMWNEQTMRVARNRTESLDASHSEIAARLVVLPKVCEVTRTFAKQLSNTAKRLEEDEESGSKRYVYVKLGADHYRHAFTYEGLSRAYGSHNIFADCDMS